MLLRNKEASVTFKKNCCVKLGPQALGTEFSSVQMLIFSLPPWPGCCLSSQILQSLRKTLHRSITFPTAALAPKPSLRSRGLSCSSPFLIALTWLNSQKEQSSLPQAQPESQHHLVGKDL